MSFFPVLYFYFTRASVTRSQGMTIFLSLSTPSMMPELKRVSIDERGAPPGVGSSLRRRVRGKSLPCRSCNFMKNPNKGYFWPIIGAYNPLPVGRYAEGLRAQNWPISVRFCRVLGRLPPGRG